MKTYQAVENYKCAIGVHVCIVSEATRGNFRYHKFLFDLVTLPPIVCYNVYPSPSSTPVLILGYLT